jgi:hypothetical protein
VSTAELAQVLPLRVPGSHTPLAIDAIVSSEYANTLASSCPSSAQGGCAGQAAVMPVGASEQDSTSCLLAVTYRSVGRT